MKKQKAYFDEHFAEGGIYGEEKFYGKGRIGYHYWPPLERHFFFKGIDDLLRNGYIKTGRSILIICGGIGHEAGYLNDAGLDATNSDYSEIAIKQGVKVYPNVRHEIQDSENLTYADKAFDYCLVRAGLHHLEHPLKGLYEMERVSKLGFGFQEAHDSLIMRLLVSLNQTQDVEPAGNYIYRFQRREVEKIVHSMGLQTFIVKTWWGQISPYFRKGMFSYALGALIMCAPLQYGSIINCLC